MDRIGSAVAACWFAAYFLKVIVSDCILDLIFAKAQNPERRS
jgi:hypothetical protein